MQRLVFLFVLAACAISAIHGAVPGKRNSLKSHKNKATSKSEAYCQKMLENCKDDGSINSRFVFNEQRFREIMNQMSPEGFIHGGTPAAPATYTYMALIGYGDSKEWMCGGSLINELYVLSAAHCWNDTKLGPAKWVRLGELDYMRSNDSAQPEDYRIVEIHNHEGYKEPLLYHDITLFKLDRPATFNKFVKPVCLHTQTKVPTKTAIGTGWGRTGFVSDKSSALMQVELSFITNKQCMDWRQNSPRVPNGIKQVMQICAGSEEGGKDTCSGDSGSPLVIAMSGQCVFTQVGITSFGTYCGLARNPGIYTRVSFYLRWIEKVAFAHYN